MIYSNALFVISVLSFYQLSCLVLSNPKQSYETTLLFIYNPASIHFSSFYSESLYSLLSNTIILQYVRTIVGQKPQPLLLLLLVALSTLLRSNSILLVPFFYFPTLLLVSHSPLLISSLLFLSVLPVLLYLWYNTVRFCTSDTWLPLLACNGSSVYSYVEKKYWNVHLFGNMFAASFTCYVDS